MEWLVVATLRWLGCYVDVGDVGVFGVGSGSSSSSSSDGGGGGGGFTSVGL